MIRVKRAYKEAAPDDGRRFLIDRLWPRGVKKEALALEDWLKEVAPRDEARNNAVALRDYLEQKLGES